jgi:hypothetical protein
MATAKQTPKPLIQIDDEIREMSDEEYAVYLEQLASVPETPIIEAPAE